jgi:SAM-dependent methyltransferase
LAANYADLRPVIGDFRWRFLERMPKGAVCAEIGVFKGDFSRDILRVTKPRWLYLIDGWWTTEGETFDEAWWYAERGTADTRTAYRAVQALAAQHPECLVHIGDDLEVLPKFPEHHFDWVYLDTSHRYEQTVRELEELRRVVKPTGIIAGDDWYTHPSHKFHGVCRAVTEYCERYGGQVVIDDEWHQWLVVPDVGDDGARESAMRERPTLSE